MPPFGPLSAIQRSEVCLLLIDGSTGILEQDKHVVGYAMEEQKAIVLLVNKWDLGQRKEI
jgi:GTP-binding protein